MELILGLASILLTTTTTPPPPSLPQQKPSTTAHTALHIAQRRILQRWRARQHHLWRALPRTPFPIVATAYTAAADECGKSDGITASGTHVHRGRTLACPPQFPFGVKIAIDGVGTFLCEDRGGAITGNHFDIYMPTKREAFAFGRRNLTARVVFD